MGHQHNSLPVGELLVEEWFLVGTLGFILVNKSSQILLPWIIRTLDNEVNISLAIEARPQLLSPILCIARLVVLLNIALGFCGIPPKDPM